MKSALCRFVWSTHHTMPSTFNWEWLVMRFDVAESFFQGDSAPQFKDNEVNSKTLLFELCTFWTTKWVVSTAFDIYSISSLFLSLCFCRWNTASVTVKRAPAGPRAPSPSDHPAYPAHGLPRALSVPPAPYPHSSPDRPFLLLPRLQQWQHQLRAAWICTSGFRSHRPPGLQQPVQSRDRGGQGQEVAVLLIV